MPECLHTLILNQNTQTVTLDGKDLFLPALNIGGNGERTLIEHLDDYSIRHCGRRFRIRTDESEQLLAEYDTINVDYAKLRKLVSSINHIMQRHYADEDYVNITFIPEDLTPEETKALRYAEISALYHDNIEEYVLRMFMDACMRWSVDYVRNKTKPNDENLPLLEYIVYYYGHFATYSEPYMTIDEYKKLCVSEKIPDNMLEDIGKIIPIPDEYLHIGEKSDTDKTKTQIPEQPANEPESKTPALDELLETVKRRPRKKVKYHTKNTGYVCEPALFKAYLSELLDSLIISDADDYPIFHNNSGRPELPIHDKLFCNIDRINSNIASRLYPNSDNVRVAMEDGYIDACPCYNSLTAFLMNPKTTPILQALLQISASPMAVYETATAVDSSGFRTASYGEWYATKYERAINKAMTGSDRKELKARAREELKLMKKAKMKIWKKAHIIIGVKTGVIISMRVTDSSGDNTGDSPNFKPLLVDATKYFDVKECTADKAYGSRNNYALARQYGVKIYIPFKSGSSGKAKGVQEWADMFYFAKEQPEEFYKHYCLRNNVESTFGAIKKSLGEEIRATSEVGQINELYCKAIAYNIRLVSIMAGEYGTVGRFVQETMENY